MLEEKWMGRALELARRGFPRALPNPLVGCVIVKNGKKIAEGYHQQFGGPHAEIAALKKARAHALGATLFVNLEPCSHWGKTPPCTQAIIQSGIRRVVAAIYDPNPKVNGRGFHVLRKAGIPVTVGLLSGQAKELNLPFLTTVSRDRPYIILKAAATLDGKITDYQGQAKWITDSKARAFSRHLRSYFDAIVVGVGTVLKDNPRLLSANGSRAPLRVVLDPQLKTPSASRVLNTQQAPTAIVTSTETMGPNLRLISQRNVEIINISSVNGSRESGLDLRKLCKLFVLKGIQAVLVEGGGATHAHFVQAGLVDELLWFVAPKIFGGVHAKTAVEGQGLSLENAMRFQKIESQNLGECLLVRATRNPKGLFWKMLPL